MARKKRKKGKTKKKNNTKRNIQYIIMWHDGAVYHIRAVSEKGATVRHTSTKNKTKAIEYVRRWAKYYHVPGIVGKTSHQTGTSNLAKDAKRKALPPGARISKTGHLYYEYRRNRTDKNPKRKL